jgi:hypothetical protein
MARSAASTPDEYVASLPEDRRATIAEVRRVVDEHLPPGYEQGMAYGMIAWFVPLDRYPDTYNREPLVVIGLASQSGYMSLYLNSVYGDPETEAWFRERWAATGKRLDMGKSCVRFRRLDDLPLDLIGEVVARADLEAYVERAKAAHSSLRGERRPTS